MYFLFVFVFYHRARGSLEEVLSRGMRPRVCLLCIFLNFAMKKVVCIISLLRPRLRSPFLKKHLHIISKLSCDYKKMHVEVWAHFKKKIQEKIGKSVNVHKGCVHNRPKFRVQIRKTTWEKNPFVNSVNFAFVFLWYYSYFICLFCFSVPFKLFPNSFPYAKKPYRNGACTKNLK